MSFSISFRLSFIWNYTPSMPAPCSAHHKSYTLFTETCLCTIFILKTGSERKPSSKKQWFGLLLSVSGIGVTSLLLTPANYWCRKNFLWDCVLSHLETGKNCISTSNVILAWHPIINPILTGVWELRGWPGAGGTLCPPCVKLIKMTQIVQKMTFIFLMPKIAS